jgi:NADH-quinone oxidoreductase subunit A
MPDRRRGAAMNPYLAFLIYLVAILGFVAIALLLNRVLGPKPARSALKQEPFECGATPADPVNVRRIPVKYYAVAVVFVVFDLEAVFLFIWALAAQPVTDFMLATFGVFTALLVLILAVVWRSGILRDVTE